MEDRPLALVIEDHLDIAQTYAEAVLEAGYRAAIIRRGDVALKRLAISLPDLVILDLHLPVVQGGHILSRIEADPCLEDTRVIVVTAHPHMIMTVHDRADLILMKPVSYEQLRDLASRLLPTAKEAPALAANL
jgi:DNA-binding response OmpR family regulator